MYLKVKFAFGGLCASIMLMSTVLADDFVPEDQEGSGSTTFVLADNNDSGDVTLQFGDTLAEYLQWDAANNRFSLSNSLSFENNEIEDVRLENLSTAPTCDGSTVGKIYYNTANNDTFTCDGANWESMTNGSLVTNSAEQTINYNNLAVNTINLLSASSANRPADNSFMVKTLGDANLKTQLATSGNIRYFRTFQSSVWSEWTSTKTSVYKGYTVQDWDQTDGSASYVGRTREADAKWLITLSVPGGFTYAQIENNTGVLDFASAWANRLTLNYDASFTP